MHRKERIAIIGGGNLGRCIASGLVAAGIARPEGVSITRRRPELLSDLRSKGFDTGGDNREAVEASDVILLCVQPQQLDRVMQEIAASLDPDGHVLISTVSGATIEALRSQAGTRIPIVRAMPNIGIAIGRSMTCLAADDRSAESVDRARRLFDALGATMRIQEEQMVPATALCACGIAFFLRAIRAASQGGIEIGFHADEAIALAAQTARGAAELLLAHGSHPETEIDKVTTPKGCTIYGLNEMENRGFSSSMIRGIITASEKADELYEGGRGATK
ncbi:MAG: pyrroline-5-carboxylate reductase [Gemmatimonadota bacterium]|jgi:pyrroline-5-carboxylate reductase